MNTLENKKQNLFLRLFKGNPLTILIAVAIYGVTAAMVYSGSAPRQFTNMIISVSCYIAVSYTHLDVYKRQDQFTVTHSCVHSQ